MMKQTFDIELGFDKVTKMISDGYTSALGPGDFPLEKRRKTTFGIIAPYGSYHLCSSSAAWSYKEITESNIPELYLILGKGKTGFNTYIQSDWETPLGLARVHKDYALELSEVFPILKTNMEFNELFTSVDSQLSFLQFANIKDLEKIKFVPLFVGEVSYEQICECADAVTELPYKITVICAGNLTYYGKRFGAVPFLHAVKENIYQTDRVALDYVCNMNTRGFLEYTRKKNFFDKEVIALFLEIMKGYGCKKGMLLNYHTSGDVEGYENSIGYGAVVFR